MGIKERSVYFESFDRELIKQEEYITCLSNVSWFEQTLKHKKKETDWKEQGNIGVQCSG